MVYVVWRHLETTTTWAKPRHIQNRMVWFLPALPTLQTKPEQEDHANRTSNNFNNNFPVVKNTMSYLRLIIPTYFKKTIFYK